MTIMLNIEKKKELTPRFFCEIKKNPHKRIYIFLFLNVPTALKIDFARNPHFLGNYSKIVASCFCKCI